MTSNRHTYQTLVWPWWCVGWYDTVILSRLVSKVHFNYIIQDSIYHYMNMGTMWHCTLVSCTPSQSIGLGLGCALFWCWMSLRAPFTIFIEFHFIKIFIIIVVITIRNLWPFFSFWTISLCFLRLSNTLDVSALDIILKYWIEHVTLWLDYAMLHSLLWYSTGGFQSRFCNWLSWPRLVSWINHLLPVCWSTLFGNLV